MVAVPIFIIDAPSKLSCWIDTFTVCIPDLYPDPLLPIATELIVPVADTIAVPPAATSGWYPNPSVDPTDNITPPKGNEVTFASEVEDAVPVKLIEVIPAFSFNE